MIVPYAGDCPHRERAYAWVRDRLATTYPSWEVVEGLGGDPWCKAAAVEDGLSRASGDILVIHDADVVCDGLGAAVEILEAGAHWVMPHLSVHRFDPESTARILAGEDPATLSGFDQPPYHGWPGGGIVAVHRAGYERAPMDPRFAGWGQEDASWAMALTELVGPHVRLGWPLWHLWHPPQPRMSRRVGNRQSEALWQRYRAARGRPDRMEALVAEGRAAWQPASESGAEGSLK